MVPQAVILTSVVEDGVGGNRVCSTSSYGKMLIAVDEVY